MLVGCLTWAAGGMGYSRYGLHLEPLSGVVVVAVAASIMKVMRSDSALSWRTAVPALLMLLLCAQGASACVYALRYEWSMRPTALSDWRSYRHEARFIFRDRRLRDFMDDETRALLDGVGAWVEAGQKATALEAFVNPDAPIIAASQHEYFATRAGRAPPTIEG